jgi:hypothetical protein
MRRPRVVGDDVADRVAHHVLEARGVDVARRRLGEARDAGGEQLRRAPVHAEVEDGLQAREADPRQGGRATPRPAAGPVPSMPG